MSAAAVAEVDVTLDGSSEREMQGKGSWRFVFASSPGIAKPAERVCMEAPTAQVPLQGFQFSWKTKSSAVFAVHPARLCKPGVSVGSHQS